MQQTISSGHWEVIHNARLVKISRQENNAVQLTLEVEGETFQVDTRVGTWLDVFEGKIGCLRRDTSGEPTFAAYADQTLRRAPELDSARPRKNSVGWRCASRPAFTAPPGLIPGVDGDLCSDSTEPVTVPVPPEFSRLAREYQMTPKELLSGFIADVCGLESTTVCPRADGYSSNGSDERMLAQDWLERAYGHQRINIDEIELREEIHDESTEQLSYCLSDFLEAGGAADELVAAVRQLVEAKQSEREKSAEKSASGPVGDES